MVRYLLFLLIAIGPIEAFSQTVYRVGPGRQYTDMNQVAGLLNPGDTVEVDGNATYPAVSFYRPGTVSLPITVRGIRVNGHRPIVSGGTHTVHFQSHRPSNGIYLRYYNFEGFEITAGAETCVRIYAADIKIRDVLVHDCPKHGILGTDYDTGNVSLEHLEVHHTGSQPAGENLKHPIYIATDSSRYPDAVLSIKYSYLHDNNGGEGIKSRSRRNEIYYNWIQGAPGSNNFYQMSLYGPEEPVVNGVREDGDVVGNVFVASTFGSNVRLGSDGHSNSEGRYRFVNNTFVTFSSTPRDFLRVFGTIESIELVNNAFYAVNTGTSLVNLSNASWTTGGSIITGRNNWIGQNVSAIPSALTGTLRGTDAGFLNVTSYTAFDPRLATNSALLNQGTLTTTNSSNYPIPNPLSFPLFHPPLRLSTEFSTLTPMARTVQAAPDIGAFELLSTDTMPPSAPTGLEVQ